MTSADRLMAHVAADPHRVAIVDGDIEITIGELFERAGVVAGEIMNRQPGATGPIVVIGAEKRDQILGALATLLAGRGFATVEPSTPTVRIHEIVRRVAAPIVLVADAGYSPLVPADQTPIPFGWSSTGRAPETFPRPSLDDVACAVFTSGSTGHPKGVVYHHDTFERRIESRQRQLAERAWGVLPCNAPLTFAVGVLSIYEVLIGATIDLFSVAARGPDAFARWIDQRRFEGIELVPSMARAIERSLGGRRLDSLRTVSTVGERLYWSDIAQLRRIASPDVSVEAFYGSTEAGLATRFVVPPDAEIGHGLVPLGEGFGGRQIQLEAIDGDPDASLEIVVVGGTIADGYLGDAEMTAARFGRLDDGTRFYRTGDLAERDAEGRLLFRGRVDDLTKIRGLLVEPAESERQLLRVPGIVSASVLVHDDGPRGPRLVGHVVTDSEVDVDPRTVRQHLEATLPPHLIPSVLVRHGEMPITDRGKLDRAALRNGQTRRWRTTPAEPGRNPFELAVLAALSVTMGFDDVSRDDDIFDLGLDSLAVQELVLLIEDRTGVALPVQAVLDDPQVSGLARRLQAAPQGGSGVLYELNADGELPPLVAVAGAAGTALGFRELAAALGADQPVIVLQQHGLTSRGRPDRTIEAAATRFTAVLDSHEVRPPYRLVGHSMGGLVAYEMARGFVARGDDVGLLAVLDVPASLVDPRSVAPRPSNLDRAVLGLRDSPLATARWVGAGTLRRVRARARRIGPGWHRSRTAVDYELMYRIGTKASSRYRPQPLDLASPVLLVHTGRPELLETWRPLVDVVPLEASGDHLSMLQAPFVRPIADELKRRLGVRSSP